jgi:hypothetical protein
MWFWEWSLLFAYVTLALAFNNFLRFIQVSVMSPASFMMIVHTPAK